MCLSFLVRSGGGGVRARFFIFFRIRGSVRFLQTALFVPSLFEKTTGANIPDLQLEE